MQNRWEYSQPEGEEPGFETGPASSARGRRLGLLATAGIVLVAVVVGVTVVAPPWGTGPGRPQQYEPETSSIPPRKEGFRRPQPAHAGPTDRRLEPAPPSPPVTFETLKQDALDSAERLLERLPESIEAEAIVAEVQHTLLGNSAEAVKHWQSCLERDRGCAEAWKGIAVVAFKKGNNAEAAAVLREALEINPTWCDGRTLLGRALMASGDIEEAARVLEENLRTSPDSVETLFLLGRAYLQLKQPETAKERLLKATELDPQGRYLYHQLATACTRLGQKEEAEAFRDKFKALAAAGENRARSILANDPRLNVDLEVMRENAAWIHVRAGKVYYLHGFRGEGAREWAKAAEIDPVCRRELAAVEREFGRNRPAPPVPDASGQK